jgi:hypothetical protein
LQVVAGTEREHRPAATLIRENDVIKLESNFVPAEYEGKFIGLVDVTSTMRQLRHDAAVAHALVKATKEWRKRDHEGWSASGAVDYIETRAAEILKSDFGIEP